LFKDFREFNGILRNLRGLLRNLKEFEGLFIFLKEF
jgi:hypothetical protein